MANLVTTETPPSIKDLWRTTDYAYRDACALFGVPEFDVDVAACEDSSKCLGYLTAEDDARSSPWLSKSGGVHSAWCNPPFSLKVDFLRCAFEQRHDGLICMMLPYEPCTAWWRNHVDGKATVVYVPDGRYNFCHPTTGKEIKGVNFASAFVGFCSLTMPTQYIQFKRGVGK